MYERKLKELEKHTNNLFEMVYNYGNSKWIKLDNKERIDSFKYQMGLDDKKQQSCKKSYNRK